MCNIYVGRYIMVLAWDCNHVQITFSSGVTVAPPEAPASRGCISNTVRNKFSEVVVRKPISALGCKPYRYGDSRGIISSEK